MIIFMTHPQALKFKKVGMHNGATKWACRAGGVDYNVQAEQTPGGIISDKRLGTLKDGWWVIYSQKKIIAPGGSQRYEDRGHLTLKGARRTIASDQQRRQNKALQDARDEAIENMTASEYAEAMLTLSLKASREELKQAFERFTEAQSQLEKSVGQINDIDPKGKTGAGLFDSLERMAKSLNTWHRNLQAAQVKIDMTEALLGEVTRRAAREVTS